MLGRLVLAGLMTIRYEVIKTGDKPIEVSKVMKPVGKRSKADPRLVIIA